MNRRDKDYLWDKSGDPDPAVQHLENILGTLRYAGGPPDFSSIEAEKESESRSMRHWFFIGHRRLIGAMAMAALTLGIAVIWSTRHSRPYYEVVSMSGNPRVGSRLIGGVGRLGEGQWLETDGSSRARIKVGDIGRVEIEPNTRVGVISVTGAEHSMSLQRGKMHALIWAPPGHFSVNTPSAQAVDLGCAYTLEVDARGAGLLRVTTGWVAFEWHGREAFVPAGAMCSTRPGVGPGTPIQEDASQKFRAALTRLDFESLNGDERRNELATLLDESRPKDALTLWHLLVRGSAVERGEVYDRLAALIPPPSGVGREAVLTHDQRALDAWWNELGLGDTDWWRLWKRPWPNAR